MTNTDNENGAKSAKNLKEEIENLLVEIDKRMISLTDIAMQMDGASSVAWKERHEEITLNLQNEINGLYAIVLRKESELG